MSETATFKDNFYAAICEFLKKKGLDAVSVWDVDDRTEYGGGCSTCEYTYVVLDICYTDSDGRSRVYTYDSSFSSLLYDL